MSFRNYLCLMIIGTIIAWIGWVFVLWRIDPQEADVLGLALFYLTLFVALVGTLATIGILYRIKFLKRKDLLSREVKISFRHGVMMSLVGVIALALSAQELLFWWNFLALIVLVAAIEYGFLLVNESRRA